MKNKYLIFLLIFCFALALGLKANAREDDGAYGLDETMFSSMIRTNDVKIISQNGGNVSLQFDLIGSEYGQAGIKYSVDLVKKTKIDGKDAGYLVDQQVFDEKIYVEAENAVHREITYDAPAFLNGNYDIYIVFSNEKGMIIAQSLAGEVALSGTGEYIEINGDSCYLTVSGGSSEKKYGLGQGVDVSKEEDLNAVCTIKNNFKKAIVATPNFKSYYRTTFGEKISEKRQPTISLNAGEEKVVSLVIPKEQKPQAYDAVLTFLDEKGVAFSNQIKFHFLIRGLSATIQDAKLDKSSYLKGEDATVSIKWTGSADAGSIREQKDLSINDDGFIELEIVDDQGKVCLEKYNEKIETNPLEGNEISFLAKIDNDCAMPKLAVSIQDKNGNVLDQGIFLMANENKNNNPVSITGKSSENTVKSMIIWVIVITTVAALVIIFYMSGKKKNKNFIRILILFVLIGGMFGVLNFQSNTKIKITNISEAKVIKKIIPSNWHMCGFKDKDGKNSNGIPVDNDIQCCVKKNKNNKCTRYRWKLPKKKPLAMREIEDKTAVLDATSLCGEACSYKYWPLYNINYTYNDHFDMYAALTTGQYYYSGGNMTADARFSVFRDYCMNASPKGYYYLDVEVEGEKKVLINLPDAGAYSSKGYYELVASHAVSFTAPETPRTDPPYYKAIFFGQVYMLPEYCYADASTARSCANDVDRGTLDCSSVYDYQFGVAGCKKYEGTLEIPFLVWCKPYPSGVTITARDVYGQIEPGDSYMLTCDYGMTVGNQNQVSARNNFGSCLFDSMSSDGEKTNNLVNFNCTVPTTAPLGSRVTNTCSYLQNDSTNYTCNTKGTGDFSLSSCPCSPPEEPAASETCTYANYSKSCGALCPGTKVCEGCNIQCYTSNADRLTVCHNYTLKNGGSCQISCSNGLKDCAGWSEVSPVEGNED